MQQSPLNLHQPGLVLLIGLAGSTLPGICQAGSGVDVNLTANIVNNTCRLSVENGGEIYLPTVARDWFYNSDRAIVYRQPMMKQERLLQFTWMTVTRAVQKAQRLTNSNLVLLRKMVSGVIITRYLKTMPQPVRLKM